MTVADRWQFQAVVDTSISPPRVTISGDIDAACKEELRTALMTAGRDQHALTVDLRSVTHIDSSAVQALFDIAATTDVTLMMCADDLVSRVISLTGLDTVATVVVGDDSG
jgi:anti-anti-sigma factor